MEVGGDKVAVDENTFMGPPKPVRHERCWVGGGWATSWWRRCVAEGLELAVLFVQVFDHLTI